MMKTATSHRPRDLAHELQQVKSLLISFVGTDPEGAYNPVFVKRVLEAAREKPTRTFRDAATFLEEVKRA